MARMPQRAVAALVATGTLSPAAVLAGGITPYDVGDKYLEIGGRLQAQYHYTDPDSGDSEDDFFFRRMRFYIEGSVTENLVGKWQVDFGKGGQNPSVKDAYIQYLGVGPGTLTVGNHYVPFSRESNTSSKRQQLVARTFVGEHNYGTPDRQMGVSYSGSTDMVAYKVGAYEAYIDPSDDKLDFGSGANARDDWYSGKMVAGGLDFYPIGGQFKKAQGDFSRETRLGMGVSAFSWSNDDDRINNANGDYDSVAGYTADVAFRGGGASVDIQYNTFSAETNGTNYTGGRLKENGEADLESYALEGGYMVVPETFEVVAGYQALDADAYAETWNRASGGMNYFINGHSSKIQATYRASSNVDGVDGDDQNEVFVQFQQVI